ncbi:(+)-neomenthol dehydrogenase [Selaginella moellendorffii]|uniref:(+)-neomenthol dehydrogenase n=1 Tax=Selaginella moellendorffii TaxID=88036 RepID=UPI000D1CF71B|nr:(+)-neomenthol dehydrogenase [Selaginella moellendorffii]|eukprot:XP_002962657.2 (+)-neomenthol dehydrogenase [Selaginella moellendorffii]
MADSQWWSKDTIAVVTGSNKGLGFAIAQGLALKGVTTILTSRDEQRGLAALNSLKKDQKINPETLHFHVLDVRSPSSIQNFAKWIETKFNGVDILVNNAGISRNDHLGNPTVESSKDVISTNYYGTRMVIECLLPLLRSQSPHGSRIINVSSATSRMDALRNQAVVQKISNIDKLSVETLDEVAEEFIEDVENCMPYLALKMLDLCIFQTYQHKHCVKCVQLLEIGTLATANQCPQKCARDLLQCGRKTLEIKQVVERDIRSKLKMLLLRKGGTGAHKRAHHLHRPRDDSKAGQAVPHQLRSASA